MSKSNFLHNASIKWKLVFLSMFTSIAALSIACVAFVAYDWFTYKEEAIKRHSGQLEIIGLNCAAALVFSDRPAAEEILASLNVDNDILRVIVYDFDNKPFASYIREGSSDISPLKFPVNGAMGEIIENKMIFSSPIVSDNLTLGSIYMELSLDFLYSRIEWYVVVILLIMIVSIPIALLVALRLQKLFSSPVSSLLGAIKSITEQKNYAIKVDKISNDELGELTEEFNKMIEQIRDRDSKLEKHAERLQEEVKKQTKALQIELEEKEIVELQLIRARDEAVESTNLKDRFVSLVSHDLKSPLATMLGMMEMLLSDKTQPLGDGGKKFLNAAINSGHKMLKLIDDLLNVGRIKSGALTPKLGFFDAIILGQRMLSEFDFHLESKGIKLLNKIPSGTRVYADEALLQEVIQNLVSNSIKFCKTGDTITISHSEEGDILVEDTGIGISPENINNIFLFQDKASRIGTAGEMGTGLGLPLCREIIEAHCGEISVKSAPGQGCAFRIKLPQVEPIVLLVDDEPIFRTEQKLHLQTLKVKIIEAENGVEALKILEETEPHLIITDLAMPEMDGMELLDEIRKIKELDSIPIIVATSKIGADIRSEVFKRGASDFVNKPVDPDEFFARVIRFIG